MIPKNNSGKKFGNSRLSSITRTMKERRNSRALIKIDPSLTHRLFHPRVPVIVCSKFGKDIAAMPANSCSAISDSPPMIALALGKRIRTNRVMRKSLVFSINWISFEPECSRDIILRLAAPFKTSTGAADKLKQNGVPYFLVRGVPVLGQACAFTLCKVNRILSTGDHDLFIASVLHAKALPRDFALDGYWRFQEYKPALYTGSIRRDPLITIQDPNGF